MAWIDRVADTRAQLATLPSRVIEPAEQRYTLDQLAKMFSFDGNGYPFIAAQGSSAYDSFERDEHSFVDYVHSIYKTNGVVFGVVLARMLLFTEARFQFQRLRKGRPGDLFSTPELDVLHKPWPNGTTGELLARAEQDVSISGNFYAVKEAGRLRRLRPDWVQIILTSPPARAIKSDVAGYLYSPGGGVDRNSPEGKIYLPHEICHWSPIPDPEAQYRGMSWLTPVLAEVQADHATTRHKLKFFQNAATPNLAVSFSESVSQAQFKAFMQAMNAAHQGSNNAYKTLYLGGGADVKVIGADLRQLDFKSTQGAGETRICAAGGVPPIIVGLSEGLQSATYSNYGMARRKFGDHWARPQWRSFCAAAESLVRTPSDARLWYDDRDIAFLREDQKDVATIQSQQASTMKQLLDAGYKPESVIAAITNEDWTLLEHTGLFSVQLQPPGGAQAAPGAAPDLGGGAPPAAPEIAPTDAGGGESAAPATTPGSEGEATPESVLAEAGINLGQLNAQIQALQRAADRLGPTEAGARVNRVLAAYKVARSKWDEASHPRGPGGKFAESPGGVADLPKASTNEVWSKLASRWSQYQECEAIRASADKLTKLQHVANPNWQAKPTGASTTKAKKMLDLLADPDTGKHRVSNRSQDAAGRWGGNIVKPDPGSDWRNPKEIVIREQKPSRRITVPNDQMDAFKASLDEPVNISLASFAFSHDDYHRDMGWGGSHGQEVFIRIDGHPRVLQSDVELVTGGQFDVVGHGPVGDSYEVLLKQRAVFNSKGELVPVEG